jgi:hypothetical protein
VSEFVLFGRPPNWNKKKKHTDFQKMSPIFMLAEAEQDWDFFCIYQNT